MLKSKRFNAVATIILTVIVIITLLPLALIVVSSFTKESALIRNGYSFFPEEWSLDAYYYMVKQGAVILRSYGVSIFVTVVGTVASVILTTMRRQWLNGADCLSRNTYASGRWDINRVDTRPRRYLMCWIRLMKLQKAVRCGMAPSLVPRLTA